METKPLLYGLIGFFIGGFIVSLAATSFDTTNNQTHTSMSTSMQMSADSLKGKSGDDFDEAFISEMIVHHQGAIDMAKFAATNARHDEIKQLSGDIISAQKNEISQMKQWQKNWGYVSNDMPAGHTAH